MGDPSSVVVLGSPIPKKGGLRLLSLGLLRSSLSQSPIPRCALSRSPLSRSAFSPSAFSRSPVPQCPYSRCVFSPSSFLRSVLSRVGFGLVLWLWLCRFGSSGLVVWVWFILFVYWNGRAPLTNSSNLAPPGLRGGFVGLLRPVRAPVTYSPWRWPWRSTGRRSGSAATGFPRQRRRSCRR